MTADTQMPPQGSSGESQPIQQTPVIAEARALRILKSDLGIGSRYTVFPSSKVPSQPCVSQNERPVLTNSEVDLRFLSSYVKKLPQKNKRNSADILEAIYTEAIVGLLLREKEIKDSLKEPDNKNLDKQFCSRHLQDSPIQDTQQLFEAINMAEARLTNGAHSICSERKHLMGLFEDPDRLFQRMQEEAEKRFVELVSCPAKNSDFSKQQIEAASKKEGEIAKNIAAAFCGNSRLFVDYQPHQGHGR